MKRVANNISNADYTVKKKLDLDKQVIKLTNDIKRNKSFKYGLYDNYRMNIISLEEYQDMKARYDETIENIENIIKNVMKEKRTLSHIEKGNTKWTDNFIKNYDVVELTRELLLSLVDKIYIDKNKNITIDFLYQDEFDRSYRYINDMMQKDGKI